MPSSYTHSYPPGEWSNDELRDALSDTSESFTLPTYEDVDAWTSLSNDSLTGASVRSLVEYADSVRTESIPVLSASGYLDYARTGNRTRYQAIARERRRRLSALTFAECVERDGRYLDSILDLAWSICEQTTWTWPAHLGEELHDGLPSVVSDEDRTVALFSAGAALLLAEVDAVLGHRLHPALRERIRTEIDERVLTPYEARTDFSWLTAANNWNAVCNAGVALSALHTLDDPTRQSLIVGRAVRSLGHYLNGFGVDGCTPEGIGYWNYGIGNYVAVADALESVTDGVYSLCAPPIVERIANYPLSVELSPGRFVPFSDVDESCPIAPRAAAWLGLRFDNSGLAAYARWELDRRDNPFAGPNVTTLSEILRDLWWTSEVPAAWERQTPPQCQYFSDCEWWFARSDRVDETLVVAAKASHNDEPHNHNDCGSFVIHVNEESLLTDLGRSTYDRDYFGPKRYEYTTARSFGHSVPLVNGFEQAPGSEYVANVVDRRSTPTVNSFEIELGGCYPDEAGVESLRRTISLNREEDAVHLVDDATISPGSDGLMSAFVSYFPIRVVDDTLVVTGERGQARVTPQEPDVDLSVEHLENEVDVSEFCDEDERDVWRAQIAPTVTSRETRVELQIDTERFE